MRCCQRPSDRAAGGVDPDIAHIQPGPQPLADWQIELQQQEEKDREKSEEGVEKS